MKEQIREGDIIRLKTSEESYEVTDVLENKGTIRYIAQKDGKEYVFHSDECEKEIDVSSLYAAVSFKDTLLAELKERKTLFRKCVSGMVSEEYSNGYNECLNHLYDKFFGESGINDPDFSDYSSLLPKRKEDTYMENMKKDDTNIITLDNPLTADSVLNYAIEHNLNVRYKNISNVYTANIILMFQEKGYLHTITKDEHGKMIILFKKKEESAAGNGSVSWKDEVKEKAVDIGYLHDWYINSVAEEPWKEYQIDELDKDFYCIPKEIIDGK